MHSDRIPLTRKLARDGDIKCARGTAEPRAALKFLRAIFQQLCSSSPLSLLYMSLFGRVWDIGDSFNRDHGVHRPRDLACLPPQVHPKLIVSGRATRLAPPGPPLATSQGIEQLRSTSFSHLSHAVGLTNCHTPQHNTAPPNGIKAQETNNKTLNFL